MGTDLSIMQLKPGMHTKRPGMKVMDHHMDNIKKEIIYLYPPAPVLMEILLPNRAVSFIFFFLLFCISFSILHMTPISPITSFEDRKNKILILKVSVWMT